jgi:hypothetical protein
MFPTTPQAVIERCVHLEELAEANLSRPDPAELEGNRLSNNAVQLECRYGPVF